MIIRLTRSSQIPFAALAMTFAVAGLIAEGETTVLRPGSAAISYPGFFRELEGVRA